MVVLYRLCSFWLFASVGGCCAIVAATSVPDLADSVEAPVAALDGPAADHGGAE